ncbi:MAG TPA: MoxR family ATPase [Gemmatimonadales bacterium]|jgi:MoxR-like ATPase|nr:MoxR family ATPase [Gemmatimonadales bacterium]
MSCSPESLAAAFAGRGYLADPDLATSVFLALELGRPLFLEGEAGVGKTAVGRTLALVTGGELIRLQCYEGLDAASALYEWDYPRQMLEIRLLEARGRISEATSRDVFSEAFLLRRPLLQALQATAPPAPVLLIDEVDRADEEFEALLLELLSEFAVTVPEIGTIRAAIRPHVIITSNRTREVHDALKRRCLYHWIEYPTAERERAILHARMPGVGDALAADVVGFVQRLRSAEVFKAPGIAETLDWAAALVALGTRELEPEVIDRTLGALLKYQEDVARLRGDGARTLLAETRASGGARAGAGSGAGAGAGAEPHG